MLFVSFEPCLNSRPRHRLLLLIAQVDIFLEDLNHYQMLRLCSAQHGQDKGVCSPGIFEVSIRKKGQNVILIYVSYYFPGGPWQCIRFLRMNLQGPLLNCRPSRSPPAAGEPPLGRSRSAI